MKKTAPEVAVTPAGVMLRFAAMTYDLLLLMALWFIIGAVFVAVNGGESISPHNPLLPSLLFIASFWFYSYFWRRGGQTLGMRAWRLRLINTTGKPLSLTQCLLRFMCAIPSLAIFGLGYFWLWFDKDKQTWHDKFSETKVVQEPKTKKA
ncbi:MAG: RDD family protein [Oceanospirillaceae bacterium]|nr:RDD family protein [Oceanospirillaceae bacterium]MCP5335441.1 RDD family protein [Oceanospirillaceae bacterium]MCP5349836.1 RDD family protein [Oceanospirillaceae bacterium]